MKPKTVVYMLFLCGSVALISLWAWALAGGISFLPLLTASLATSVLCVFSATITARKIRKGAMLTTSDVTSGAGMIALALGIIGLCVLIWEFVPSRHGAGIHLDRRYSLLFFAIAAYFLAFPFLAGWMSQK